MSESADDKAQASARKARLAARGWSHVPGDQATAVNDLMTGRVTRGIVDDRTGDVYTTSQLRSTKDTTITHAGVSVVVPWEQWSAGHSAYSGGLLGGTYLGLIRGMWLPRAREICARLLSEEPCHADAMTDYGELRWRQMEEWRRMRAGKQWLVWRPLSWRQTLSAFAHGHGWHRGEWIDHDPHEPRSASLAAYWSGR
jgi:hypothetical protein